MKSEWKEYKLGEMAVFSYGKMPKKELLDTGVYPTFSGYKYQYTYPEFNCEPGDLIVVARGVGGTGDVKIVKERCFLTNLSILIKLDNEVVSNKYLYYNFLPLSLKYLDSGSAQSQITINDLKNIYIPLPDLPTQTAIASILSSLDDKIELNNAINKNLEALAQALFKRWFVDFEFPNEEGLPYKSSGGEMVESELGMIPKGWRVDSLDGIADYLNGLALQKFPPENEKEFLPVIKIREMRQGITEASDKASTNIPEKYIVTDGDILFSWSGSLIVDFWTNGKGALNQHLFKVTSDRYPKWFIYLWTKYHLAEFVEVAQSKATTMGHIQRKHLSDAKVLIPDNLEILRFTDIINPIIDQIITCRLESNTLIEGRDTLLPKLISGELYVNNAINQINYE